MTLAKIILILGVFVCCVYGVVAEKIAQLPEQETPRSRRSGESTVAGGGGRIRLRCPAASGKALLAGPTATMKR